jgi:putative transcriptional regulator
LFCVVREKLKFSRPVFARYLRAKPNAQAALLIRMVEQFPDMLKRMEAV